MKTYRGSAAAARRYVEGDRGRADDYYLAEGTGIAERYAASPEVGVRRLAPLTGDQYEAWVAGFDPDTGAPRGRLRNDENAVRFVEVVVNGPKSWSLAAELHPDISLAYDAAQDAAAAQIIGWLAEHATTRVGPRGAQLQVPVRRIEAATVRHYTSRAGDPHRHLHLQINARVFAEGAWRGLHTVGVRDSLDALNGIGHAAVMTDPGFRKALAGHGFTLDPETGEVAELAEFVGPFSARAAQIGRNIDRYETAWRAANPGQEPGRALLRSWDARAWADARPDKVVPRDGAELTQRWVAELRALGYREARRPARVDALPIGAVDRDGAVREVLSRLAARRSGWNAADVRGEVEQLVARRNVVTDASVRAELAEDLTARTVDECVPLLDRPGVPEHIRALSSRHVLDVEAELTGRLAARVDVSAATSEPVAVDVTAGLDAAQCAVVAALAGDSQLLVVEGAAGAGKTSTLAAARAALERSGHRLMVVTPTRKAARVAAVQIGSTASSAAWLAYRHGFRWTEHGTWTRLHPGQTDPDSDSVFTGPCDDATLRAGDLLLVDEAGMLDQDTAHALLSIADEHHARLALVGDRHQLPAVGRGGVLDLAARWATPDACLTLDTVHRFVRTTTSTEGTVTTLADAQYAQLSLAMRTGADPLEVFDALLDRDQIRVHTTEQARSQALADAAVDAIVQDRPAAVVADTREQVAALNDAIRERLVASGRVDDGNATTTTSSGQRIGAGDRVATRRNDADLDVANRDTWIVTDVTRDGRISVTGERGRRSLPAGYVRDHVELAYASTVYGVQGETAASAHLLLGEHTTAAAAYVGLTRGRETNVAHLVADSIEDAREQWVSVFARDRADLGPTHAAELAEQEAARYAGQRALDTVLAELHQAWTLEGESAQRLATSERQRERLREVVTLTQRRDATVPALKTAYLDARAEAERAAEQADRTAAIVSTQAGQTSSALVGAWEEQRPAARQAASTVRRGAGRLGQRHPAVNRAIEELARWSAAWQPYLPSMPTRTDDIVRVADGYDDMPRIHDAFDHYAREIAEQAHPEHARARDAADTASQHRDVAWHAFHETDRQYRVALAHHGTLGQLADPAGRLAQLDRAVTSDREELAAAQHTVARLLAEPALRVQPGDRIAAERARWAADRDQRTREMYARIAHRTAAAATHAQQYQHEQSISYSPPDRSPGISR